MFNAQTPEEQKMGRNPLTSPSTKKLQAQRIEQKARIAKVNEAPVVDPKGQYWSPYDFTKPEGEKEVEVIYSSPIKSIAVMSIDEAAKAEIEKGIIEDTEDYINSLGGYTYHMNEAFGKMIK